MTHQDGIQDEVSQEAHNVFTHNLDHADAQVEQMNAHAVNAHPQAHQGHMTHKG